MFMVGWDKQEINIQPQGYAMFGYGMWSHRAYQKRTALFARTFTIRHLALEQPIIFVVWILVVLLMRSVVVLLSA